MENLLSEYVANPRQRTGDERPAVVYCSCPSRRNNSQRRERSSMSNVSTPDFRSDEKNRELLRRAYRFALKSLDAQTGAYVGARRRKVPPPRTTYSANRADVES